MLLLIAITSNPITHPLLILNVYEEDEEVGEVRKEDTKTLQRLVKKLSMIAQLYSKTVGKKIPELSCLRLSARGLEPSSDEHNNNTTETTDKEGSCLTEVIQLIAESNGKKVQEAVCQLKSGPVTPMGYWQHKRDILSVLLEGMISNIWML